MFNKYVLISSCLFFSSGAILNAQTKEERADITSNYNIDEFTTIKNRFVAEDFKREEQVAEYLSSHNLERSFTDSEGTYYFLHSIDDQNNPVYWKTLNDEGILTINANHLYTNGSLGLNLDGGNLEAGIWDGGNVRDTHADVVGRITLGEFSTEDKGHASHVGGTIIGNGASNSLYQGVAPAATLISYQFNNDRSEMLPQAFTGMLLSNHSYGLQITGSTGSAVFGKYSVRSNDFDTVATVAPYYLPIVSAGNDRNDGWNAADNGYDLLTGLAVAKNALVVGAVNTVDPYIDASSVSMSSFSSWGPTDDGRIKPDIVAKGVSVTSLSGNSDTGYFTRSGTSMSAPMVTGGVLLLQQLHNNLFGNYMKSATVRGLVCLTAQEAGTTTGPDYRFGWGLLDLKAAAELILDNNSSPIVQELNLLENTTYTTSIVSNQPVLKVAISWTDRAATINTGPEDDNTPAIVNDLDMIITDSNGNTFSPWKLDPISPNNPATKGDNTVDNIEIVQIDAPAGTYQITVSHKGTSIVGPSQDFTLLVLGADPVSLSTGENEIEDFKIFPNPATDEFTVLLTGATISSQVQVQVYDILGQQVLSNKFDTNGSFRENINVSQLKSGIYMVRVGSGTSFSTRKLVIK